MLAESTDSQIKPLDLQTHLRWEMTNISTEPIDGIGVRRSDDPNWPKSSSTDCTTQKRGLDFPDRLMKERALLEAQHLIIPTYWNVSIFMEVFGQPNDS